jgi:hypothetical protein
MMAHLVQACLLVAAVIATTFLPFVAGGYDLLAGPLAAMAWAFGRVGLLLVPVGGLWLWASVRNAAGTRPGRWLTWITIATSAVISLAMIVIAFASSGSPLLAAGTAAIAGIVNVRVVRRLRAAQAGPSPTRMIPAALVVAPLVILAAQAMLVDPFSSFARNRGIANSAPLIAEIESYRSRHGAYPVSLFSLYGDCKPSIVGVERYYYEPSGDAYNVIFEEPSLGFGTRRFVVYNPRDQQRVTVHELDRLRLEGAALDADNAGYTLVEPLPQPHWKAFLFLS